MRARRKERRGGTLVQGLQSRGREAEAEVEAEVGEDSTGEKVRCADADAGGEEAEVGDEPEESLDAVLVTPC